MQKIELVFCFNDTYFRYFFVAFISLIENLSLSSKERGITVHILFQTLSDTNISLIQDFFKKYKYVEILFYEVEDIDMQDFCFGDLSLDTFVKIKIPNIISAQKILYLDCDILVLGDIGELFDQKIDILGAVIDPNIYLKKYFDILFQAPKNIFYFNAGVLLMNLDAMRELSSSQKIFTFLQENQKRYMWHDQGGFNFLFHQTYTKLPLKYNFIPSVSVVKNIFGIFEKAELLEAKRKPIIIHFAGNSMYKPWYFQSVGKYKKEYLRFFKMTPFILENQERNYFEKGKNIFIYYLFPKFLVRYILNIYGKKFLKKEGF